MKVKNTAEKRLEEDHSFLKDSTLFMKKKFKLKKATGKLGVLIPGIAGAVSTTFIAGILAKKNNIGELHGSLAELGTIRLGKRTAKKSPLIKDVLPLSLIHI